MLISIETRERVYVRLVDDIIHLLVRPDCSVLLNTFTGPKLTFEPHELLSLHVAKSPNLQYDVANKNGMIFKHIDHDPVKGNLKFMFQHYKNDRGVFTDVAYNGHVANDVFTIIVRDN